ncbi:hypothetical protein [Brevibacillus centrosporus]|uniref:hypothetical protein n=1 Tax=Brevibacillus centrosporus TaxID=54910 RepID=UPI003B017519
MKRIKNYVQEHLSELKWWTEVFKDDKIGFATLLRVRCNKAAETIVEVLNNLM